MTPSRDLLTALDYLYNAREMQIFRRWLATTATDEALKAIKATENVDVLRGRAQMLLELQVLIEEAPEALQRLEKRNGKPDYAGHPQGGQQGR